MRHKYVIETSDGTALLLSVHKFGRTALAVFSTEEKAQDYIDRTAENGEKSSEELGRPLLRTEQEFRDLLIATAAKWFWMDPVEVYPDQVGERVLDEMTHATTYLQS